MNKKLFRGIVIDCMIHLLSLRFKQGMTENTWDLPTHSPSHTHTELSRATNCISILVHSHFHACAFKITSTGVVWCSAHRHDTFLWRWKGQGARSKHYTMLSEFTAFTKSPVIIQIKGAFGQQKLQLICPEITGSKLWLCAPLSSWFYLKWWKGKGGKMEHMAGGKKKKTTTGKIWFQTLRISMPVLFFLLTMEKNSMIALSCSAHAECYNGKAVKSRGLYWEARLLHSMTTRRLCSKKMQIWLKQQVGYLRAAVWYVST